MGGDVPLFRTVQVVLRSADGGATWVEVKTGTDDRLYGVSLDRDGSGFAVGENGVALHTTDRGESWRVLKTGVKEWLSSVSTVGGGGATAVGAGGIRLITNDGGATWRRSGPTPQSPITEARFFDADHGLAVGADGLVLRTGDGGSTWELVRTQARARCRPSPSGTTWPPGCQHLLADRGRAAEACIALPGGAGAFAPGSQRLP